MPKKSVSTFQPSKSVGQKSYDSSFRNEIEKMNKAN